MSASCPSCKETFPLSAEQRGKATVACPRCGRVVVLRDAVGPAATTDPGTEPALEPARPAELPTQIGVASQTLSLPQGKRVSLAVLSGARRGEAFVLERPRLTLGRSGGGADLELPDPDVSRSHAALECHGARIVLRDLGSRNGTFVAEERVSQRELTDRSEFRVGGTTFLLLVADA
jgi:hypothetical protein